MWPLLANWAELPPSLDLRCTTPLGSHHIGQLASHIGAKDIRWMKRMDSRQVATSSPIPFLYSISLPLVTPFLEHNGSACTLWAQLGSRFLPHHSFFHFHLCSFGCQQMVLAVQQVVNPHPRIQHPFIHWYPTPAQLGQFLCIPHFVNQHPAIQN
jgi:hypothetical protein